MQTLNATSAVALKKILLAPDLSATANNALLYAAHVARQYESTLFAVHAIQPRAYPQAHSTHWFQGLGRQTANFVLGSAKRAKSAECAKSQ